MRSSLTPLLVAMVICLLLAGFVGAAEDDGVAARAAFDQLRSDYPSVQAYRTENQVTRLYGQAFAYGDSPLETAENFVSGRSAILGVTSDQLQPYSLKSDGLHTQQLMYDRTTGNYKFTLVYYAQEIDGIPVYDAELRLLVRNESGYPLVLAISSLRPIEGLTVDKSALAGSSATALQAARTDEPGLTDFGDQEAVIFAGVNSDYPQPTAAVTFVGSSDFPEKFRYVIDPVTGNILHKENLIIFEDVVGNVSGMATPGPKEMHCSPSILMPFPYAEVSIIGGNSAFADANGDFVIPNSGTNRVEVVSGISGQYFDVFHYTGTDEWDTLEVSPPGPINIVHNSLDMDEEVRAQANGYVNANEVRDWTLTYNPTYPTIYSQTNFPVNVNRTDGYCPGNAWYSGTSINFCLSSSSYGNTSFASVSQHEYGHHLVEMAGSGQDQYGEGMSDCVAMLIADDPGLGYGFYLNQCNTPLRSADNSLQYPCSGGSHDCGMLLSGCVWDIREEMEITYPGDYLEIVSNLTVNSILLHTGSLITPQIAIDFLTLDDDDANIDNGTPHHTEICTGFSMHNMDCPALAPVWFSFPNGIPGTVDPYVDATVQAVANAGAVAPIEGTGKLYVSVDGGPFEQGSMIETAPNEYDVILPGSACDARLDWYLEIESDGMGLAYSPSDAPASAHQAVVATESVLTFRDNFQTDNGWTVSGSVSDGPWERAVPAGGGDRGDPPTDFDGSGACYVTDNADDNSDVDDGTTILTSPLIDLSTRDAKIHYARWYSNNFGSDPNADVMEIFISNDDGGSWVLVETIGPVNQANGGWYENAFWVSDFVTPTSLMRMRFEASDLSTGSVVEAAVDDFSVTSYECTGGLCGDVNGDAVGPNIEDLVYLVHYMFQEGPEPIDLAVCDVNGNGVGPDIEDLVHLVEYMFQEGAELNCY